MVSSLKSLCNSVILDNPQYGTDTHLPDVLADKLAKLAFSTAVHESDLNLIHGVTTLTAPYPILPAITQKIFNDFKNTLESLVLSHTDFREVTFGHDKFSQLKVLKLAKARNLTQEQFDALCHCLPPIMQTLHIIECENVVPNKKIIPQAQDCTIIEAEKYNPALELSIDD